VNNICHVEIPSANFEKAKKFYGELFNWKFTEMPGMDYLLFNPPEGVGGGFSKMSELAKKPGVLVHIEVADIEATIKKAEKIGGRCLKGKTQITPEYGYFAIMNDLEGNQIGLWSKK